MSKRKAGVPAPYDGRIAAFRAEMARARLDGYLVSNRMHQYWLTGFTGEDGYVLVTRRAVVLLTDGRFDEAADIQAPYAKKVLRKVRTPEANAKIISPYKLGRLGFDPGVMTVGDHIELAKRLRPTRLVSAGGLFGRLQTRKDAGELAAIRRAIDVAQKAFLKLRKWIRPGQTEREVAARLEYEMRMLGAQGPSFPTIVAFGKNASLPHYEPGDVPLVENDPILIDWGAQVDWYTSDLTRMIWPAKPPRRLVEINRIVRTAHDRAIAAVRPGMKAEDLDNVAREVIRKAGYGPRFNHSLGHGMGLNVHEPPRVGMNSPSVIEPGMVFTIEPGIYLPGAGGVRIEDDVLVTENGCEVLTTLAIEEP
jgi:Xaa-Pro aminopeptidase